MSTGVLGSRGCSLLTALGALALAATAARADDANKVEVQRIQANAAAAQAELPPAPGEPLPPPPMPDDSSMVGAGLNAPQGTSVNSLGSNGLDTRDAVENLPPPNTNCIPPMVPMMQDGQQVLDLQGQGMCKPPHHAFIKGELTNLGATKLKVKDSRFGISFGYTRLDSSSYLHVEPQLDLAFGKFSFGLGVPLNIRAYANGFVDGGGVHLRSNDYSSSSDYARVIRFITYGAKEDNFYLNISQLFAATIGHGTITRRFSGEIDQNITRVGAQLDAYGRFGGFEAFIGDIISPASFMSGLAFLKPLGFMSGPLLDTVGQTSIGISAGLDLHAPFTLKTSPGTGGISGTAPLPKPGDDGEPQVATERSAAILGLDLETKILKTENADIKPFLDYSRMLDTTDLNGHVLAGGGGGTLGMLGRFNAGDTTVHAFRIIAEGRYFGANYQPGYFDTFYEIQKFQDISGPASSDYQTKLKTLLERDPSQKRLGFYAEFGYQYNEGFAVLLAYENSGQVSGPTTACPPAPAYCNDPNQGTQNLTLHIEYPVYSWFQFFGSYYKRNFSGSPFSDGLGNNTLIYAAARLHILPILFLNVRYYRSWQADQVLGVIQNVPGFEVDLEFGYEFDRSKKDKPPPPPPPK